MQKEYKVEDRAFDFEESIIHLKGKAVKSLRAGITPGFINSTDIIECIICARSGAP